MEVVRRVEALVHASLVSRHSALDGHALRRRLHDELLQVVELNLGRRRSLLAEEAAVSPNVVSTKMCNLIEGEL